VPEITFHGTFYDIESAPVVTKPVQRPFIPWYATRTPDKARWCARLGMPMLALVPSRAVRVLTDAYREEWASLGRAEADLPPLGQGGDLAVCRAVRDRGDARFPVSARSVKA
jgi:alkanesulfonate monooxygenase SsuD/methylene tetrahydromethanopterin reductase-like flavin-dependent oxidoreductase (luciferase family)